MTILPFLQILKRAYNGPICKAVDWDAKIVSEKASQKLKEYDLEGTCDIENPVNRDDDLADDNFRAGFELAVELGFYCTDTERIVKVAEQKLHDALRSFP